jgi:type II secretory pathway predicted ATPase ExeA
MYETHFGLKRRPFRTTPDLASYYPATSHETALSRLLRAVEEDEGLVALTGKPGTGKTLLGYHLLDRLGSGTTRAFLTNSHFSDRTSMLQALLFDWCLPFEDRTEQELRLAVTDVLLKNVGARRRTIVVVDEAQHLRPDVLEELRLLGNLEAGDGKAFQVIFLAQPTFLEMLRSPELEAFGQRLAVRVRMEPLGWHEAADYLVHHLRCAGGRGGLFADEALELLARGTRGVPRLLNQAAHQALVLAHDSGVTEVDAEAALESLALLGLDPDATVSRNTNLAGACNGDHELADDGQSIGFGAVAAEDEEAAASFADDNSSTTTPRPFAPNRRPA